MKSTKHKLSLKTQGLLPTRDLVVVVVVAVVVVVVVEAVVTIVVVIVVAAVVVVEAVVASVDVVVVVVVAAVVVHCFSSLLSLWLLSWWWFCRCALHCHCCVPMSFKKPGFRNFGQEIKWQCIVACPAAAFCESVCTSLIPSQTVAAKRFNTYPLEFPSFAIWQCEIALGKCHHNMFSKGPRMNVRCVCPTTAATLHQMARQRSFACIYEQKADNESKNGEDCDHGDDGDNDRDDRNF